MSEKFESIHIPKATGTHSDVFAAVGLADLLASVDLSASITLIDRGSDTEVRLARTFGEADLRRVPQVPGYPFLKANDKVKVPAGAIDPVDYRAEKGKVERWRQTKQAPVDSDTQELMQLDEPRDDWQLLRVLNALQGDESSNRIHEAIISQTPEEFHEEIAGALDSLIRGQKSPVKWKISTVQLFTPTAAKGYSRLKPDSTDRNDKTKEQWADPFVEWLRYRGYFRVACPYFQGTRAEHVRMLCPIPHHISVRALESITRELRKGGVYGGPPKMDALAVLRLAELLIRHSEEYHNPNLEVFPGLSLAGKSPAEAVSGMFMTHYHSLGNARAVSAMYSIALPGWFPIQNKKDANVWLEILGEHQAIVRGLRDNHSDEIGLLIAYRSFLQQRGETATWSLIGFMEHYGPFLVRAREQKRKVRAFRTDHFGRIVMATAPKYKEILSDAGFQSVASAVRRATVSAQFQKAMGKTDYREIRYDLLHELRRKRSLPGTAPLIETVSDFISKYNAENARRRELKMLAPRNVTTEEFAGFAGLVEAHGASTIGALLCAYSSCREPQDQDISDSFESSSAAPAEPEET